MRVCGCSKRRELLVLTTYEGIPHDDDVLKPALVYFMHVFSNYLTVLVRSGRRVLDEYAVS